MYIVINKIIRSMAFFIILFFISIIFTNTSYALNPTKSINQYVHKIWQIEDGLPQNSVNTIIQTNSGYIWMGTEDGLVRFDGVNFTVFNQFNTKELTNNDIRILFEDNFNNLWIGTYGGGLILYKNKKFKALTTVHGLSNNMIRAIFMDSDNNLWIGTNGGGLNKYKNGKFTVYKTDKGLSNNIVRAIHQDKNKNIWIGTDKGLNLFKNNKFETSFSKNIFFDAAIWSIYEDKKQNLWVGTNGGGLYKLYNEKHEKFSLEQGLTSNVIRTIFQDSQDNLWLGTDGGGLNIYRNNKFIGFSQKDGLSSNMILSVFEDKEKNFWIGTEGGGLNLLRDGKFTAFTKDNGLTEDIISPIYEDSKGNLWIGTWSNGLNILKEGKFSSLSIEDGLSNNRVRSILEDKKGNIWIGTRGGGLNRYKDGTFQVYSLEQGLSNSKVFSIIEDDKGVLWIGTYGGGINKFENEKFTNITTNQGLSHNVVTTLLMDSNKNIWAGTFGGGLNKIVKNEIKVLNTENGLSNNKVFALYEDKSKNLWIGTYGGGLNLYKNEIITVFTSEQGLYDNVIYSIMEDSNSNLWFSGNKGIFYVNKNELLSYYSSKKNVSITSVSFSTSDGMKSRECNGSINPASFKTKNGKFWFPTIKGAVVVDPDHVKTNAVKPPVHLEKVIVDQKEIEINNNIKFNPEIERMEFHYAGLSYSAPEKVKFKYKLKGFDRDWVNAESRRIAYYTNLSPGKYTFKVIACNNDGLWNKKGASLTFVKMPFFYQTKLFYLLCIAALFGIFYSFYRAKIKKAELKQRELELFNKKLNKEVKHQTKELRQAISELKTAQKKMIKQARLASLGTLISGVSHEIGNPLNSTLGGGKSLIKYINKIKEEISTLNNDDYNNETVSKLLNKSTKAINLINDGNSRIEKVLTNLRAFLKGDKVPKEPYDFKEGIHSCLALLNKRILSQNVKVIINLDNLEKVECRPGEMNQVFTNLIINSLDILKDKGKIEISGNLKSNNVVITFLDNGPGIPEQYHETIFDPFFTTKSPQEGTGLGLYISYEIVRKNGGELSLISHSDGACFEIKMPILK